MYTAVSGQSAIFKQMEIIANNLANATTAGFKAERLIFEKALKDEQSLFQSPSPEISDPLALPTDEYVQVKGSYTDLTSGPVEMTNNPLDVAITNKGFFVLNTPDGIRYTRNGQFQMDEQSRLVSFEGHPVQGQGGDIVLGAGNVQISEDGSISLNGQNVGQLRVVEIESDYLIREPGQKFALPVTASVSDIDRIELQSGAVEGSNVNPVKELADMIFASRMYESLQKVQQSSSQMTKNRNEVFGRG